MKISGRSEDWISVGKVYNYEKDKCRCGVCDGLGTPWRGWFSCENCPAISLIETGETFMPT